MIATHQMPRRLLQRAMEKGRLSHAYLVAGPEGAGKRTLALDFARGLLCAQQVFPACGSCSSCQRVEAGSHPDLHRVEAEGRNVKIDSIRELTTKLQLHSFEGGMKVGIVPESERMTVEAQNAFLKTLEEPSASTILILTSSNLGRLLPTTISRCQLLRVGPMPTAAIRELLETRRGLGSSDAELVASLAGGNATKALDLELEFVVGFRKKMIQKLLSLESHDRIGMLDFAEDLGKASYPVEAVLDLMSGFYRDVLSLRLGLTDLTNRDLVEEATQEAQAKTTDDVINVMDGIHRARLRVAGNANARLNWEILTMFISGVKGAETSLP